MPTLPDSSELPPIPDAVTEFCRSAGLGAIQSAEPLKGGAISRTVRLSTTSGQTRILKQSDNPPPQMYQRERDGLETLRAAGAVRVPVVNAVGPGFLLLEDLGQASLGPDYWETFGRLLARQHRHTTPRFGFDHDNYLGRLPQRNPWTDDGHDFFIQQRILRFLETPLCQEALSLPDRRQIERFAARLRERIPAQPAALLHGDLWTENMRVAPDGQPAMIDPAVYYGWPEAELSMVAQYPGVPESFFAAYNEIIPLASGWPERLEMLTIREWLSMIAHFGDRYQTVGKLRTLLTKFD